MFDFIKKKIQDSITSIQKKFTQEEKEEQKEEKKQEVKREELKKTAEEKHVQEKNKTPEEDQKKSHRLLSHKVTESDIYSIYSGIKVALIENNVAMSVIEAIHRDLNKELAGKELSLLNNRSEIEAAIKKSISSVLLSYSAEAFIEDIIHKKPYIILFVGVNGSGKTTTLSKLADLLKRKGIRCVISASDTFRAASIEQLETHCKRIGVEIIKHDYGADPAAVAFDAIKHARAVNADAVLIDTAGRSDINKNLIEELKKVKRVSRPDRTIFVGDALTGNDVVKQAEIFDKEIGIDMTIISKADVDKKGGAVLSVSYITKKPIVFLGTGQNYGDLVPFDVKKTADFIFR